MAVEKASFAPLVTLSITKQIGSMAKTSLPICRKQLSKNYDHEELSVIMSKKCSINDKKWNTKYLELKSYYDKHGHSNVGQRDKENASLGKWLKTQRSEYRSSKLSQERIDMLASIKIEWDGNKARQKQLWMEKYRKLKSFQKKHGHCKVPTTTPEYLQLNTWLTKQRLDYHELKHKGNCKGSNGHDPQITRKRFQLLEEIGVKWESKEVSWNKLWEQRFKELKEYKAKYETFKIPQGETKYSQLYTWTCRQRQLNKNKNSKKLSAERIAKLDSIGFEWVVPKGPSQEKKRKRDAPKECE